jgi:hypothetical protein
VLDLCWRLGCRVYRVSRSVDSRPLTRPWYCSPACREIATLPMHWLEPGTAKASCGGASLDVRPHLITTDLLLVTCGNCKRTGLYRKAAAA